MKRTASSLTFIVPGLLDPVPYLDQLPVQDLPDLATFTKMLSRGTFTKPDHSNNKLDNFYSCVMNEFTALSTFARVDQATSIASLTYLSDSLNFSDAEQLSLNASSCQSNEKSQNNLLENKWIMRADPSFMAADRDQLVLARTGKLELTIEEARSLVDEINSFFEDFDDECFWTLKVVSPERWYIISDKAIDIPSVPPENVLGQSVKSFLFSHIKFEQAINQVQNINNDDISHWLTLFNEFQMILHQSEVNKKRIQEKKTPINSLWFWGAGKGIDHSFLSVNDELAVRVYSNHSFVKSISRLNNGKCCDLPLKYEQSIDADTKKIIYVVDDFKQAINNKDIFTWVGLLKQFEENYLLPIMDAIDNGSIAQVEFISPSGRSLLLTKKLLKRWWKKNQTYYSFLSTSKRFKK